MLNVDTIATDKEDSLFFMTMGGYVQGSECNRCENG